MTVGNDRHDDLPVETSGKTAVRMRSERRKSARAGEQCDHIRAATTSVAVGAERRVVA